ncbi:MAG: GtrA-like protein [Chloroflexi bacterium ADurb.Bin325]|nr:MAG: GtrA-like protein [Chloroflexi bacterium ADurb.Bin325]
MSQFDISPWFAWLLRLPIINRLPLGGRQKEVERFLKFAIVGAFGMVVDLTVLNVLHKALGLHLLAANSISFTTAVISNFTWNRLWTFPESRQRPIITQLGQFAIVNVVGLGINNAILWAVFRLVTNFIPDPLDYNLAKVTAIGVVLFWNFFVNRAWTYKGIK